jgi:hypothetical protein
MDDPLSQFYASPRVSGQSASVVQIESSKLVPLVIVLAILSGVAIGLTSFAFTAAGNAEREARMLQYYVMELDGKLMAAGVIESKESFSAKQRK